jgi:hypothetical protein
MSFPSGWSGYEEIYIPNMPSYPTTTGQVFKISTTGFSTEWKNAVGISGQDVRVTTANGTRLPVDVVYMNNGNGHIEFNLTGDYPRDPRERIRFWVGNTGASFEPTTGIYGQYNVYPFNLFGYYPSGGGIDRTRYQNHLTGANTTTGETHLAVFPSTFYSGAYNSCVMTGITGVPLTMVSYVKTYTMTGNQVIMGLFNRQSTGNAYMLHFRGNNDTSAISVRNDSGNNTVGGDNYVSGVWGQFAGKFSLNNRRDIYKDGEQQASSTVAITGTGITTFGLGTYLGLTQSGSAVAHLSFVELYSGGKSEAALSYDYDNPINNSTSYGWHSAFNPVGWSGYDEITINEQATGALYDQTYILSTCLLSPTLLSMAQNFGGDLRIVKTDNVTELPIDVIHFDKTQTGMLGFIWPGQKIPGQIDKFRVWAGNSSATKYAPTDQFGQYNAYSTGMIGFYPSGGGRDRTSNQFHMTGIKLVSSGNLNGPLSGLYATDYSGTPANMGCNVPQLLRAPVNIFSVFRADTDSSNQIVAAIGSISNSRYTNAIRLNQFNGVTHHMNVTAGILEVEANSGFNNGVWYSADAYQDENINRYINLNGDYRNTGSLPVQFGSNALSIGGYSGTSTPSTGEYFNGAVSLTAFDTSKRYGYESIYNYHMVFDHPNFYSSSGWTNFDQGGSGDTGISYISLYGVSNVFTNGLGLPFSSINVASISSTNTAIYGLMTSDGITLVSIAGVVSIRTSSYGGTSKGVNIAGSINTSTLGQGAGLKSVGLSANSNTQTSSIAAPIVNITIGTVNLVGESGTKTASIAAVTVLISAAAISEVRTMLEGYAINVSERPDQDNFDLTVYVNVENEDCLYICRSSEMPLFITKNKSNNLTI